MLAHGRLLPALAALGVVVSIVMQWQRVAPIGPVLAAALYFIIWWVVLFAVLPFGVRTQSDAGEVIQGTSAGAPTQARMLRVVLINTAVASAVFCLTLIALGLRLIPLELIPPAR